MAPFHRRPRIAAGSSHGRVVFGVHTVLGLAGVLLPASTVVAQTPSHLAVPPIPIETFTLDNGLRVIVSEDHSTPIVAVELWYHVGSAHEPEGRSGFAHLFEHLLLEETEQMRAGDFKRLITRAGGVFNGATELDHTAYSEVLPSNRINLALWTHAERMARLRITEETFEIQRQVVREERRLRVENRPYAASRISLDSVAYRDYAPYRLPVIGTVADLEAATLHDALRFYDRFYRPNHAVLTVVGDVTPTQVRALAERYFGRIPAGGSRPSLPEPPAEPRTDGERRRVEPSALARLPLVWMAYTLPPADHPDHPALALLSQVLGGGERSRLRRRFVTDEALALDVTAQVERHRGPGVFLVGAVPTEGVDPDRMEGLLDAELARLADGGIGLDELDAARTQLLTSAVTQRMTVESKAALLQRYTLYYGSPHRVNQELERFSRVTPHDLRRVAATWLVPENRTVVITGPPQAAGEER